MTVIEPITPPAVAMALIDLADCACDHLTTLGGGATCWCGVHPGAAVSWEYCGECEGGACGMGWVRLVNAFPYQVFPIPVIDDRCILPLAWTIEVGALRCVPQPPTGEITDPVTMTEVSVIQVADGRALYQAIKCCAELQLAVQSYTPVGPQGGCVGGFWTAYAPIDTF